MKYFCQVPCKNWYEMSEVLRDPQFRMHWLFRGESLPPRPDPEISLQTSLGRASMDLKLKDVLNAEKKMMRDFRRKYDGADRQIVETDTLYCMSLMRHYGAPTRLLDWTYSPFVAAYFALERWHPKHKPVLVVWCLSDKWCEETFKRAYPRLEKHLTAYKALHDSQEITPEIIQEKNTLFEKLFMRDTYDYVYPVNPLNLHTRLNAQQGVFLCAGRVSKPVSKILASFSKKK